MGRQSPARHPGLSPRNAAEPEAKHDEDQTQADAEDATHAAQRLPECPAEGARDRPERRVRQRLTREVSRLSGRRRLPVRTDAEEDDEPSAHADAVGAPEEPREKDGGEVEHGRSKTGGTKPTPASAPPLTGIGGQPCGGIPSARVRSAEFASEAMWVRAGTRSGAQVGRCRCGIGRKPAGLCWRSRVGTFGAA